MALERTGFSADQGSIFNTTLNSSESSIIHSPPPKFQKLALCVVSRANDEAGVNASPTSQDQEESMSQASSTNSHIMIMEAALKAKKAKHAAAILAAELEADIQAEELKLVKAKLNSSARSSASSVRSRRRLGNNMGKGLEPIMDFDNLSRDLSKLFDDEEMFHESPIRTIVDARQKNDERTSTYETASTAESAGL